MRTFLLGSCTTLLITTFASAAQADGFAPSGTPGQRAAQPVATRGEKHEPVVAPAATSRASSAPRVASRPITTVSPRRTALMNQLRSIREEQDRLAAAVASTERDDKGSRVSTPAGISAWPQAPFGTRAIATAAGSNAAFGIHAINGRTKSIRLTPGGKVVITGLGLGAPTGVRLVGGSLDRHPVLLRIVWRTPTRIDAEIPSTTRGSPDEQKAVVEVRTSQGATYRFDGVSFIAAREEITITDAVVIQAHVANVEGSKNWAATVSGLGANRLAVGKSINCPAPGTDLAHFARRNGFDVVGATMATGRTDSGDDDADGNAGSRVFTPGYSFGDWVDENVPDASVWGFLVPGSVSALAVNWGVFRSHTSPHVYVRGNYTPPVYGNVDADSTDPVDRCSSDWWFTSLTLYGPAGVAP
jgi:hypothetical protein